MEIGEEFVVWFGFGVVMKVSRWMVMEVLERTLS